MRPKKPADERRNTRVTVLMTEREHARIVQAAANLEVDVAVLIRRALKEWVERDTDRALGAA